MKKGLGAGLIILAGLLSVWDSGFGQIIENPAKPAATNAGRVVVAEEVSLSPMKEPEITTLMSRATS